MFIEGVENYETHIATSVIALTETIRLPFSNKDIPERLCQRNSKIS
jgi:hypothetical protein